MAQNKDGSRYKNSNYSTSATISAPGNEVPVLSIDTNGKIYIKTSNGTSVATANISGLVALILSINNKVTQTSLITKLKNSVERSKFINAANLIKNLNN